MKNKFYTKRAITAEIIGFECTYLPINRLIHQPCSPPFYYNEAIV